ncbi:MAG: hypothetical protein CM1200mP2_31320 [Planctomycetaceae bacterium]|nr:MAG: hypothetical protein CM1200mP2_31320 [Planctomycetaceae bacterium]
MSEFSKPRIIYNLERTRVLSLQMIERVPHEQWFEMPTGVTHVAWHVGHMAIAGYFLGLLLVRGAHDGDEELIPSEYRTCLAMDPGVRRRGRLSVSARLAVGAGKCARANSDRDPGDAG